jgi:lantibiotic modifying enzyme
MLNRFKLTSLTSQRLIPILNKITASISAASLSTEDTTLWTGSAGTALYYAALQEFDPRAATGATALALLATALDEVSTTSSVHQHVWLFWAARAVDQLLGEADNTRFCRDFDEALLESLHETDEWNAPYDLIYGLVSIGAYGLCASADSCGMQIVERVLQLMQALSIEHGEHQWWPTTPRNGPTPIMERHPQGYCDLGLAHGNAGVAAFLARAVMQNIARESAAAMLAKLLPWLIAQQNPADCSARFPYIAEEPNVASRCAWCYGDVGISWALVRAGEALQQPDWIAFGHATARAIMQRSTDTGFADDALCHGRAGVAHILLRHATYFNDAELAAHGLQMLNQVASGLEGANSSASSTAISAEKANNLSWLEGQAGIGLALMAAAGLEFGWDYPLLLG